MGIKRKVRWYGESLAITIPSQIAELHDIREGDYMEFVAIKKEEIEEILPKAIDFINEIKKYLSI